MFIIRSGKSLFKCFLVARRCQSRLFKLQAGPTCQSIPVIAHTTIPATINQKRNAHLSVALKGQQNYGQLPEFVLTVFGTML